MARPDLEWVAVAAFTDTGRAGNVAAYLQTCGLQAHASEGGTYAHGEAPVFVAAGQVDQARELLRRLEAGDFSSEGGDEMVEVLGAQLVEDIAPASGYQPPSALQRWAPFVLIPAGLIALMLVAFGIQSLLPG